MSRCDTEYDEITGQVLLRVMENPQDSQSGQGATMGCGYLTATG